jgi:nitrogen fixation NifU-like protein
MDNLYQEIILDAYKSPQNRGTLPEPKSSFEDENPLCGDVLRVDLRIRNGIVEDAKFDGRGCAISMASAELMLERIKGQPIETIQALSRDDVFEELGVDSLTVSRVKCAMLSVKVLKGAAYGLESPVRA